MSWPVYLQEIAEAPTELGTVQAPEMMWEIFRKEKLFAPCRDSNSIPSSLYHKSLYQRWCIGWQFLQV